MPTYTFRNKATGQVEDRIMSISARTDLIEAGEFEQIHNGTPRIVTGVGENIGKTSGDWRDLMKSIKKGSGKGNSINT